MAVQINLLERRSLTAAVNKTAEKIPSLFIERMFFGTPENHLTRTIDWEHIEGSEQMAIYMNPSQQSHLVENRGSEVKSITLPYTNEHKFYSVEELAIKKGFGGDVYVNAPTDIANYRNEKIAEGLVDLVTRIRRRREWAAAQAVQGKVSYQGKNTAFTVDFGFGPHNVKKNAGADKWDSGSAKILQQADVARRGTQTRSGVAATFCVMGTEAADLFVNDEKIMKALDTNNYKIGQLDLQQTADGGAIYLGMVKGVRYYQYAQSYRDESGVEREMFPTNLAIYAAPSRNRRLHYGPIHWIEGTQVGEFATRRREKQDPDGIFLDVASCSLPIIHDNGSLQLIWTH